MERGVYFDGWFKNNHCYHPSLPLRSLQMIEDLERYHGTVLVWSAMGGGSISLPYLENEAFGPVDARMRFYGYMNDSEFVAECNKRGIKVFAIVFEVQGWEFPAVIDEKTGEIKRLNLHADQAENHDWYGLREFSQNKYANAFRTSLKDYYPNGIYNSDGELVTDLWEESAARRLDGSAVHAEWVEVKNHKQICYQTCRNNPVWRDYLKQIMKIQIDAGVPGIQLDECELPITSIGGGGCFCKDCMKQFTAFLKERKAQGLLGEEWDGIDVDTFNYKDFLIQNKCSYPNGAPFYREYWEFQLRAVKKYFSELVDYAKDYARTAHGRELMVSGNFFNLMPCYYPIENKVDLVITEMEHTLFRQPHFYRYCNGFAAGKPIIIAENPYGGIIPQLLTMLDAGQGYDLYRMFLLEASVYGCNMSVPYGGWMGNTIKDSFYPPRELTTQVQDFLFNNERFYPKNTRQPVAVLYSFASYYWRETTKGGGGGNGMQHNFNNLADMTASMWHDPSQKRLPFWEIIRVLSDAQAMYDVQMLADDVVREDDFALQNIADYPLIVLPDLNSLTDNQAAVLNEYAQKGGKVLVYGALSENCALQPSENVVFVPHDEDYAASMEGFLGGFNTLYRGVSTVSVSDRRLGVQRFDEGGATYVHLLNYDYDIAADVIRPAQDVTVTVKNTHGKLKLYTLDGVLPPYQAVEQDGVWTIRLNELPIYTVLVFEE